MDFYNFEVLKNLKRENEGYRGRMAPSTSGYLHLGHARTFAVAAARAASAAGTLLLRIEDIDCERCTPEYARAAVSDLYAAGFSWNEGDDVGGNFAPYTQSKRLPLYREALLKLIEKKYVYPCFASRSDIRAANPHFDGPRFGELESEPIFPMKLRPDTAKISREVYENPFEYNWRFRAPDGEKIAFDDINYGNTEFVSQTDFGDFLVWRKIARPSYELAVVVDDASMGITEVVRGADLLVSTARQLLLYRALSLVPPSFFHCPLLRDCAGRKISKSTMNGFDQRLLIRNDIDAAQRIFRCAQQ